MAQNVELAKIQKNGNQTRERFSTDTIAYPGEPCMKCKNFVVRQKTKREQPQAETRSANRNDKDVRTKNMAHKGQTTTNPLAPPWEKL